MTLKNIIPLIPEEYLELVEPEKEETKYLISNFNWGIFIIT